MLIIRGSLILGINEIKEVLYGESNFPCFSKYFTIAAMSPRIISQYLLMNLNVKPSGLGVFSFQHAKTIVLISSTEMEDFNDFMSYSEFFFEVSTDQFWSNRPLFFEFIYKKWKIPYVLCFCIMCSWKNLVFSSPSTTHLIWDFCLISRILYFSISMIDLYLVIIVSISLSVNSLDPASKSRWSINFLNCKHRRIYYVSRGSPRYP